MPEWTVQGAEKAYLELVDEDGDGVELIVGVGRVSHDERRGDSASIVVAMLDAATGRKRAGKGDGRGETRSAIVAVAQSEPRLNANLAARSDEIRRAANVRGYLDARRGAGVSKRDVGRATS